MIEVFPNLGTGNVDEQLNVLLGYLDKIRVPSIKFSRLITSDPSTSISNIQYLLMNEHLRSISRQLRRGPIKHTVSRNELNYDDLYSLIGRTTEEPSDLLVRFIDPSRVEQARTYGTDRDEHSRTDWHLGALERQSRLQYRLSHLHQGMFTYASPVLPDFRRRIDSYEAMLIYSGSALQELKPIELGDESHNSYDFHVFSIPSAQRALLGIVESHR